jgi:Bacteriophage lambda head decoration protein D
MTRTEGFTNQGEYKPDNLLAGEYPRIERLVTIAAGADLAKGTVLGRITANGKFKLSASASSDGSQTPDAILAEKANAASADAQAIVYFSGEFNENALILGAGHTLDSIRIALRAKSIFLRKNQTA